MRIVLVPGGNEGSGVVGAAELGVLDAGLLLVVEGDREVGIPDDDTARDDD